MRVMLLAAVVAQSAFAQQPEKKELPKPLSAEVVKAWTDAGATVLWVRLGLDESHDFRPHRGTHPVPEPGLSPLFHFKKFWKDGRATDLPEPGVAFGVSIHDPNDYKGLNPTAFRLKELAKYQKLTFFDLSLHGTVDLGHMAQLKNLTELRVASATNKVVPSAVFGKLESMTVSGMNIRDKECKVIAKYKSLTRLHVTVPESYANGITQEPKELAQFQHLSKLGVKGPRQMTDAGVQELAGLKNLAALVLSDSEITDAASPTVAKFDGLTALDLRRTKATVSGLVRELAGLKKLTALGLPTVRVVVVDSVGRPPLLPFSGPGVPHVTHVEHQLRASDELLRWLRERGLLAALVVSGELGDAVGVSVDLSNTSVTDTGLKELAGFKRLTNLKLTKTWVTADGVAELQKALPNCTITR